MGSLHACASAGYAYVRGGCFRCVFDPFLPATDAIMARTRSTCRIMPAAPAPRRACARRRLDLASGDEDGDCRRILNFDDADDEDSDCVEVDIRPSKRVKTAAPALAPPAPVPVCSICQEDVEDVVPVQEDDPLPHVAPCCGNYFHDSCIYLWMVGSKEASCPACRGEGGFVALEGASHRSSLYVMAINHLRSLLYKEEKARKDNEYTVELQANALKEHKSTIGYLQSRERVMLRSKEIQQLTIASQQRTIAVQAKNIAALEKSVETMEKLIAVQAK